MNDYLQYVLLSDQIEAEKLFKEVLGIRQRVLGPEHPQTLASMIGLAASMDKLARSISRHQSDLREEFFSPMP